jgi:coenzyme F420 hydrogenase subunit beta
MAKMLKKNVLAVGFRENHLCTRCGTCAGICPVTAITLDGQYYPQLDREKCTECGLCGELCPGDQVHFERLSQQTFSCADEQSFDGHILHTYIGHAVDREIHELGTGGGIVTALFADMLDSGAIDGCVVTRMRADKPWLGEPFIARSREELMTSQGSRYTVIPLNSILNQIRNTPGKYGIAALPCHMHGLRSAIATNPIYAQRIVALLGVFCGGALEPVVVPELLRTKGIKTSEISSFEFRGGEWPGQMRAIFPDKQPKAVHYSNYKDGAYNYLIGIYMPRRCQICYDGSNLFADISVGDSWTRSEDGKYKYKSQSRIMVRTTRGEDIIAAALERNALLLKDVTTDASYRTHQMRTRRKGLNAPLRLKRWADKGIAVPEYDRPIPEAGFQERMSERLVSSFLLLGRYKWIRYPLVKMLTSKLMVPLIKLRLWRKKRKYQARAEHKG